jgi:hypothetical protein
MPKALKQKNSDQTTTFSAKESGDPAGGYVDLHCEIQDTIARRAYELFESRGSVHGHDLEDWFRSEQEALLRISISIDDFEDKLIARAAVRL